MSLPSAINSAQSGLSAAQSLSRITAGNVANAMTPGYVRREGVLVSQGGVGGGVLIGEIRREVDTALARVARQESGKMAKQQAIYEGLRNYVVFLGQPDDEMSPSSRFSDFSTAITTLVNLPSSNGAQLGAVVAAEELAASIRGSNDFLAQVRAEVDMEIRYEVADLNQTLYDIADINSLTTRIQPNTPEAIDNQDKIDRMIDDLSQIADIRITKTSDGWVNIYSVSGAALLEGDKVYDVTYNSGDQSFYAGTQEITPAKSGIHGLENGSLAGFAELTNEILPRFQLQLDEYARLLIQNFETVDSSLGTTDAGLFTDNGSRFDATKLEGLAGRLSVNELVAPTKGAEVWRIRDGLGAVTQGDAADTTQIQAMIEMFEQLVSVDNDTGLGANITMGNLAAQMVAGQQSEHARAEVKLKSAKSAAEVVQSSRRSIEGVNIDDEMQRLAMIEQSFTANSKLLTVIMEMYDTLLAAV
jgi:flagellar hook-associated protein 1